MTDFPVVDRGPWRIHSGMVADAVVKYRADGKSQVVTSESLGDLALLRDAITEYLQAVEADR